MFSPNQELMDLYEDNEKQIKTGSEKEKADILSKQFSEVFISEPEGEVPVCERLRVPTLDHLNITEAKNNNVIGKLKSYTLPGPDELHPRVIKELLNEIRELYLPCLSVLFKHQLPLD